MLILGAGKVENGYDRKRIKMIVCFSLCWYDIPVAGKKTMNTGRQKEDETMISNMLNNYMNNMSHMMAEDVNAPELRNPLHNGMKKESWLRRVLRRTNR